MGDSEVEYDSPSVGSGSEEDDDASVHLLPESGVERGDDNPGDGDTHADDEDDDNPGDGEDGDNPGDGVTRSGDPAARGPFGSRDREMEPVGDAPNDPSLVDVGGPKPKGVAELGVSTSSLKPLRSYFPSNPGNGKPRTVAEFQAMTLRRNGAFVNENVPPPLRILSKEEFEVMSENLMEHLKQKNERLNESARALQLAPVPTAEEVIAQLVSRDLATLLPRLQEQVEQMQDEATAALIALLEQRVKFLTKCIANPEPAAAPSHAQTASGLVPKPRPTGTEQHSLSAHSPTIFAMQRRLSSLKPKTTSLPRP